MDLTFDEVIFHHVFDKVIFNEVIFDVVIHFNRDFQRNVNSYEFDQLFDF
jgi:hypothetical protein